MVTRTGRGNLEDGSIDPIHAFELGHVGERYLGGDGVRVVHSGGLQNDLYVVEASFNLGVEVFRNFPGMEIKPNLAGNV
jgi:hypothetical protein